MNSMLVDRPHIAVTPRSPDRAFYLSMSLASVVAVFIGFAPTYYLKAYFGAPALRPLVQLHGFLFTSWIVLFVVQTALVASHQVRVHRRLGVVGAWLAGLIAIVGTTTAIASGRRTYLADSLGASTFLAVPLADMLVFAVLAAAAIYYRRRPDTHKRLMMLATIGLLDAAIARWRLGFIQSNGLAFFVVTDLFVVAAIIYDLVTRRRVHPANVYGGVLLIGSQPLRLLVSHTSAWLSFASLLLR